MKKIFTLICLMPVIFLLPASRAAQLPPEGCIIGTVQAEVMPCNDNGYFHVSLNFEYQNVGGEGFNVHGNGHNYGNFNYADLPVTIGPLLGDGTTVYEFVVNDLIFPDCQNWTAIDPVSCGGGEQCHIYDLVVDDHPCLEGYFNVYLNFEYQNVSAEGFRVYVNEDLFGTYTYDQLPLESIGPFLGDGSTVYHFWVSDIVYNDCGDGLEFGPINCGGSGECHIWEVTANPTDCNEAGNFWVVLNFNHENVGSEGFHVVGNGNNYGNFYYEDLPVEIGPLVGDGTTVYEFGVIDNQFEGCSGSTWIEPVDCGGGGGCECWDLIVEAHPCVEGFFSVYLDFEHMNGCGEGFNVYVNEDLYGTYAYEELPLESIGPFPGDGTTIYHFSVSDILHPDCGDQAELGPIDCGGGGEECHIFDLVPTILPCNEDGMFMASLNFGFQNTGDLGYRVIINEDLFGEFSYEHVPVVVGPLAGDGITEYHITVRDNQFEGCYDQTVFAVDCGQMVPLDNMTMLVTSCSGGSYFLQVDFDPAAQSGSQFTITSNLGAVGTYDYASLPLTLGPFNTDGITGYYLVAVDAQNGLIGNWRQMAPFTCETLGFEELPAGELFTVFPNPSTGAVNFRNNGKETIRVNIHDLLGSQLRSFQVQGTSTIAIDLLNPGLYFYSVLSGKERTTGKLTIR